ncbi:hypothetical protein Arad_2311 [Rhizobium rhizogenes K84]|uniref:Uncharacterized protein n=2 Tax=Rhizobium rhizogenes TaxID=359 RepID=B9JF42_RHIR8|nr:hypothetical protein Arad_2311 [Rhizobium rhizogenes K84]
MPIGIPNIEISNLHNDPSSPRLWWAEVKLNFDETIEEYAVSHWVTLKVRVTADETVTVQELRENLFQKAVAQLRQAVLVVEGKTAQQLLDAAHQSYLDEDRAIP